MTIDIQDCDINNDYFHFTNKSNVDSILNNGLIPTIGVASKLVNDRANVSVSKGGKGIMGIINSFIYKFYQEMKISDIPEDYKKYFLEIKNFELNDEVYFRVKLNEEQLSNAKIGGLTGYDVNLPMKIDKSQLEIIIDENNKVLSAYDVAQYIYNKAKDIEVFRKMHNDFFYMFEM